MRLLLTLTIILSCILVINAQEIARNTLNTAAANHSNDEIQLTWSIGNLVTGTLSSETTVIMHSLQQGGYVIEPLSTYDIANISVYPNPSTDYINYTCNSLVKANLIDMNGNIVLNNNTPSQNGSLNLKSLSPAIYILQIKEGNGSTFTYRIIKQ